MTTLASMNVIANGTTVELPDGATVTELLAHLSLTGRVVAVERNGEPVERRATDTTVLNPGDRCEIVRAVAGG